MISFGFIFFLRKVFGNKSLFVKILFELLSIFFTIALIYYAGQSFAFKNVGNEIEGPSLFAFLIVGEISLVLPMSLSERIISNFLELRNQQFYQTLLGLQISPVKLILSRASVDAIFPLLRIVFILLFCALFLTFHFTFLSVMAFCGIQLIAIGIFIFMGLITNLLYLKFNRGIGLFYSVQSFASIVGGLYFPINFFPAYIKNFAIFLPQTQILKASREIFQLQFLDLIPYFILISWFLLLVVIYLVLNYYLVNKLKRMSALF